MTNHSPGSEPRHPLPLQQTVRRMVETLANAPSVDHAGISHDAIRAIIRARQARASYLPPELLSDPAWGMLLELFHGELAGQPVSMSSLCKAAAVPDSTAARWLKALEGHELTVRRSYPDEPENAFVELTPKGSAALRGYFRDILGSL